MNEDWKAWAALAAAAPWVILAAERLLPLLRRPMLRAAGFCRRRTVEALILAAMVAVVVHRGATKGTNGTDRAVWPTSSAEVRAGMRDAEGEAPTPEGIRFTAFSVDTNAVCFSVSVPSGLDLPARKLDLFAAHDVDTNVWELVGDYDIPPGATNLSDTVALSVFPFADMNRLFLVLGTRADLDEDGMADAREKYLHGTSPLLADTDGDGLLDGEELAQVPPLDPRAADSDGDGYLDGEEALSGTNPHAQDAGAANTIRYFYDDDDRLVLVGAGAGGAASGAALSPAGNGVRTSILCVNQ